MYLVMNIYRLFGNYTMEIILAIAFGRCVEVQKGESDDIVTAARKIFKLSDE